MAIPNSCIPFCCGRMVCLKKFACMFACCLLSLGALTAFAKDSAVRVSKDRIALTQTQSAFEAVIEVQPENTYAGVEIAIACPEGMTVTASSGSSGSMSAGPVFSNGLYWTSFFESDNNLSGTMKITLQFSCSQSFESGDILFEKVKVLTKEGLSVATEDLTPSLKVSITRDGSETTGSDTASKPSGTDTSAESSGNGSHIGKDDIPATGDSGHLSIGIAVLLVSGCVVLGGLILFVKRKKLN